MGELSKQIHRHNVTPRYSKAKLIQEIDRKFDSLRPQLMRSKCFEVKNKILLDVIFFTYRFRMYLPNCQTLNNREHTKSLQMKLPSIDKTKVLLNFHSNGQRATT